MPIPVMKQIVQDIVAYLHSVGGQAQTREIHEYLAEKWGLTPEDRALQDRAGGNHVDKQIDGAIAQLSKKNQIAHPQRGLTKLVIGNGVGSAHSQTAASISTYPVGTAAVRSPIGEHDDLQKVIAEMGRKLGKTVETGSGVDYKHDVLWKDNPYRGPSHVWEICDRGNLDKDVAALTSAADPQKWGAKAILVVTGDSEYSSAQKKLAGKPVLVVRSEVVKRTAELVNSGDIEFLKSKFS